jgi:hypothetical protein
MSRALTTADPYVTFWSPLLPHVPSTYLAFKVNRLN